MASTTEQNKPATRTATAPATASPAAAPTADDQAKSYDAMTLDELRALAAEREVSLPEQLDLPADTEKSLWVAELRADDAGKVSVARLRTMA